MRKLLLLLLLFCQLVCLADHPDVHVAILGDSNTWIGGDSCDKAKGWNKWFKDEFAPASCVSYARSGATWTNTENTLYNILEDIDVLGKDNVIYNQINRLVNAVEEGRQVVPNLIIIAAGTNDAWFQKARPMVFGMTVDEAFRTDRDFLTSKKVNEVLTLAESVRYGCEMLMDRFPMARIILLTPMQSTAVSNTDIRRTGDIIEECGRQMGISVIRQDYNSSVCRVREEKRHLYTSDGTHTNEKGARQNGCLIAHQINQLLTSNL